jgi:hypothetical protein
MEAERWLSLPLSTRPGETFPIELGSLETAAHLHVSSVRRRDGNERKS